MSSRELVILNRQSVAISQSPVDPFFPSDYRLGEIELRVDGPRANFSVQPGNRPCVLVGRSPDCDVILDDKAVSYRHAYFQLCAGRLFCVDLDSRTGTRWGPVVRSAAWVGHRETVSIGPYGITAEFPDVNASRATVPTADLMDENGLHDLQARPVELSFRNSRHAHRGDRRWRISQPITLVGRSKKCRLRLDHETISAVHCSLFATSAGLWAIDLLGRDGVRVNGQAVDFTLLQHRDELQIGGFRFGVRYSDVDTNRDVAAASDRAAPVETPSSAGLSEKFMLDMVDRFAAMQQQMTAVSQQQMAMMAQMVDTLQGNYKDLVQQELAKIQQLSSQIDELRDQVTPADAEEGDTTALPHTTITPPQPSAETALAVPEQPAPVEAPPETPALTDGAEADAAEPERRRVTQGDIESHTMLIERMSSLEKERTSRWKKLMRMIAGGS